MYFDEEIISYIELVRNAVPNAIDVFTNGNCGSFAMMLMRTFSAGRILNTPEGHLIYEYGGRDYDIRGDVTGLYKGVKCVDIMDYGLIRAISLVKPRYKSAE